MLASVPMAILLYGLSILWFGLDNQYQAIGTLIASMTIGYYLFLSSIHKFQMLQKHPITSVFLIRLAIWIVIIIGSLVLKFGAILLTT